MLHSLIASADNLILIIGDYGSGKTTLLERLVVQPANFWSVCRIRCYGSLKTATLLDRVARAFNFRPKEPANIIEGLNSHFAELRKQGKLPIILLDDAHELDNDSLLSICRLGTTGDTRNIVRLVLFCDPRINSSLAAINSALPKQVVLDKIFILPLNQALTSEYIKHRLQQAGLTGESNLTAKCIKAIHNASGGLPGRINEETHNLLLYNITNKNFGPFEPIPKHDISSSLNNEELTYAVNSDEHDAGAYRPAWLLKQNPALYTLQITSSRKENVILKIAKNSDLEHKASYFHTFNKGKDWYILTYSIYSSLEEAEDAVKTMPLEIQGLSPWARSLSSIHEAIKKGRKFIRLKK